jgi:hypothetical protein
MEMAGNYAVLHCLCNSLLLITNSGGKMFNLELSKEQKMIKKEVAKLVKGLVTDEAKDWDLNFEIPKDTIQKAWELGASVSAVPEEFGGFGMTDSPITTAIILEELAYGDMAFAVAATAPSSVISPLLDSGTKEQQSKYLPIFCDEDYKPCALAMNEEGLGFDPNDLRQADAIEIVLGQGAKPGGGGMLLGLKVSPRVAQMRTLPEGIDQRSACRHPDWTGPDDLAIKIGELREITDWKLPIYVKLGATRVKDDVKLAVKAGADVVVVDGMQGGTAATQQVFIEHTGIPTLPAVRLAVEALEEMDVVGKVQLIVSGGIRSGADVAKALALGADAVALGQGVLMALGCNSPVWEDGGKKIDATDDYENLGTRVGFCHHCQSGLCPVGITTQDEKLEKRLDPAWGAHRLKNYLQVLSMELTTLARACGKSNVHHLEREDLVALTVEAAAMAKLPLAGTDWIPGE